MAKAIPIRPRAGGPQAPPDNPIAVVASKFNKAHVDALVESCVSELKIVLPDAPIHIIRVPGALEIPVTMKRLSHLGVDFGCYIALGVIVQGETKHGDHVASSVTHNLVSLSLELDTPIINEVLHVASVEQANARCYEAPLNRGLEAARSAHGIMSIFQELEA